MNRINQTWKAALKSTFSTVKLIPLYTTLWSRTQIKVNTYLSLVTSRCIYQLTCICKSMFIVRIERQDSIRFNEHILEILCLQGKSYLRISVVHYLLDPEFNSGLMNSFKVINKHINSMLLEFWKTIVIRRIKPDF